MGESVEAGPFVHDNPLDIEQIYSKARNQWLSRPQICQILQNHKGFPITSAPHNKPPSGSLFLFNKEEQRYFRNDGHNWTKKKDGKTLLEGHRLFEVEGFGNLNCYYAHGKENRNFLRRCYWMAERDFSYLVLVHYLEETEKSEDFSCVEEAQVAGPYSQGQESVESMPNSKIDSSRCPGSHPNNCRGLSVSEYSDKALLPHGAQALERENAQSEYNHQASSGFHFDLELQHPAAEQIDAGGSDPKDSIHESLSNIPDIESDPTQLNMGNSDTDAELAQLMDNLLRTPLDPSILEDNWESSTHCGKPIEHGSLSSSSRPDTVGKFVSNNVVKGLIFGGDLQIQEKSKASVEGSSSLSESACDAISKFHEQVNHPGLMGSVDPQQKRRDLRNNNSKENYFQRPLSKEKHGYVLPPDSDGDSKFEGELICSSSIGQHLFDGLLTEQGSKKRSSSGDNGETGGNENENDVSSIPSEGILDIQDINDAENYSDSAKANLLLRFDKILCSGSSATNQVTSSLEDASPLSSKISSLLEGENKDLDQMLKTRSGTEFSFETFKDHLFQKHLKEKLHVWILQKVVEGGDGPSILDEGGLGVLHLAAALGFDWALEPTIVAGVSVDFRDVNGWTALHWAAFCGRKHAVASLISLGAAPGALTDRSREYPSGRTPADLASVNGHKGIAGYLANRSLDVHIPSINLDRQDDAAGPNAVQKISEISAAPLSLGNASDGQSQKDSFAPTCDAATAPTVLRKIVLRVVMRCDKAKKVRKSVHRLKDDAAGPNAVQKISEISAAPLSLGNASDGQSQKDSLAPTCDAATAPTVLRKIVLKVDLHCNRERNKAMNAVSNVEGVDSISFDMKTKRMQVIGDMDPEEVVRTLDKIAWGQLISVEPEEEKDEEEGPEKDKGGEGPGKGEGPEKDEGPEKEKQNGKKRAPDPALESGKADKILKAYLAYKALLSAYYNVQSMETTQMLVLIFVGALKKIGERKLSHIDNVFEPSPPRV